MKRFASAFAALLTVVVASTGAVSPAEATLIGINVPGLGPSDDGFNITRDTDTGLDWLDLTLTGSENFDDVVAGSFYSTHGFQHATEAQVAQLFINAGLVMPDSTPITSISLNQASSIAPLTQEEFGVLFDAVERLSIFLGDTALPTGGDSGDSIGVTGTPTGPSSHSTAGIAAAYSPFSASSAGCWGTDTPLCDTLRHSLSIHLPLGSQADNSASGQIGHFLVRATPTAAPEPTTLALFALALAGLGFMRRGRDGTWRERPRAT